MTHHAKRSDFAVTICDRELATEASAIGIRPGAWPCRIEIDGARAEFARFEKDPEGGVVLARYVDPTGELPPIVVFND